MNLNEYWQKAQTWVDEREQSTRALVLIGCILIIYLIWNGVFSAAQSQSLRASETQIAVIEKQLQATNLQLSMLKAQIAKPIDPQLIKDLAEAKRQLAEVNQKITTYTKQLITPQKMIGILKELLMKERTLTLSRLENGPATPAIVPNADPAAPQQNQEKLFKHNISLEFYGDYFGTLDYLQRLEKLPWLLHWDSLNYQVLNYPNAMVTLKLHLVSTQESLIGI